MMSIQLGGVFAKEGLKSVISKLTGTARYRGTKWRNIHPNVAQIGWHREQTLLVPIG
ncbi:hypothetical protein ACFQZT_06890 [Paenibacillus sp. GCM10027628]|uniref:hypothetical protein n=1 Tax=Paenibacillus sp. GCM10027628 TaxID=3273413 RepID=UPI003645ECD2